MNNLGSLQGQKRAKKLLEKYLQTGAPPLMILSGPEGTGRYPAAEAFVRQSFCTTGTGCGQCVPCKKLEKGTHPDLIQFPEDKVLVGNPEDPEEYTVRWLIQKRLRYSPFEANQRFVLIPSGHLILHEAETALLKALEEPPDHTRFLILVRDNSELKETILSRGAIIPFYYLPRSTVESVTDRFSSPEHDMMGGSFHLAPFFSTELYRKMTHMIKDALDHPLNMLELERWLLSGEKNRFSGLTDGMDFDYTEVLDVFATVVLKIAEDHPARHTISREIFLFKRDLRADRAGMHPFLLGRLFHSLTEAMEQETAKESPSLKG